jgi:branched-chain amino acid transport system substrate-binding protein
MPRAIRAVVMAALVTGLVAACTATPTPTPTPTVSTTPTGDGVLRIGTLFPASGTLAFLAPAQVAGVNAAIRDINAAGGVNGAPVEVLNRDSGEATTQKAEESFADLVARGVDVVIGPSSSVIAERLLVPATEAAVPIVSPSATFPRLSELGAGVFFRTIPAYGHQGAALAGILADRGAKTVVLVYSDDDLGTALLAAAEPAFEEAGVALTAIPSSGTAAEVAAAAKAEEPDAVVLATPDAGDSTKALITELVKTIGGAKLWLTSQNLADYSQALPAGVLTGVNGILEGVAAGEGFRAKIRQEDPGVVDFRYAAEAYDATILVALAAILAADDAGRSVATTIRDASIGGIKCTSFGECVDVLKSQTDIDYDGASGSVNLDEKGDPERAPYGIYLYDAENRFAYKETVAG